MVNFVMIDTCEEESTISEQIMQEAQPRPHHCAPFVVTQAVLDTNRVIVEPLLDEWRIHVVVVGPALVPSVVGRVDENAVYLSGVQREQRFEGVQVVSMNN